MELLSHIQLLENQSDQNRFEYILRQLKMLQMPYEIQEYATGKNIVALPSNGRAVIGISSHYDTVLQTAGANDNASSVAVCLGILEKLKQYQFKNFEVIVLFFDEEEVGLKGSKAFVNTYGIDNFLGLLNLEMLGQGNQFALWSLNNQSYSPLIEAFEKVAFDAGTTSNRFDKIVTNSADHLSFRKAGLKNAFSITCISEKELEVAYKYYKAQEMNVSLSVLKEIMQQAPLFQHYHQMSDLSIHLDEKSLQLSLETIWKTLLYFDEAQLL